MHHSNQDNPFVVIHDQTQPCPYIEGREARMPLEWPIGPMSDAMLDNRLAAGFRRSGSFLYRTQCDGCAACEPVRVEPSRFVLTTSLRRVLRRGDRELRTVWDKPSVDDTRIKLFNLHRAQRKLSFSECPTDAEEYRSFLVETICDTREMSIWKDDRLIAVATTDFGVESMSLVYCYFDPDFGRYCPGTYSILKHFQLAGELGMRYVYLGLYVANNPHLNYKARFTPQQRRLAGRWIEFT